ALESIWQDAAREAAERAVAPLKGHTPASTQSERLTEYENSEKEDAIAQIIQRLEQEKENPKHFFVSIDPARDKAGVWTFHLWHRSAFLTANWRMMGNPGGKCRDILYDVKAKRIDKVLFWQ